MNFLKEKDKKEIIKRFEVLKNNVKILFFTQELECQYCHETGQLLKELCELSDKIKLETYNFITEKEVAEKYKIDKVPGIVVMSENTDYGVRYYGIPAGYEFSSLLESIEMISTEDTQLSQDTIERVKTIDKPVHIQVFVTPTCPYCPSAVLMGHALAMLNRNIRADMVEATEFPQLAHKYNVRGVPRVVINENHFFEGALPENLYLDEVMHALEHNDIQ